MQPGYFLNRDSEPDITAIAVAQETAALRMLVGTDPDAVVQEIVNQAVQSLVSAERISELGGDPAAFARAQAAAVPQVETVGEVQDEVFDDAAFGVAAFGVAEKASRVVEILPATIRPCQLLAGKVLGIGVYGLFQVLVLGGSLALAAVSLGMGGLDLDVNIGSVTTPLLFLLFIPFYTTMFLVPNDPDSTLVRILSQVPIFAPFIMPVRDAFGRSSRGGCRSPWRSAPRRSPVWGGSPRASTSAACCRRDRMKLSEALRSR